MRSHRRVLVLVAGLLLATSAHAARIGAARPIGTRAERRTTVAAEPTALDAARRLARNHLMWTIGDDWDEVLVSTVGGSSEGILARHGGSWRSHGAGRDVLKRPVTGDPFDWFLEVAADADALDVQANFHLVHPGCRQMSIDVLEVGADRLDLATQPAILAVQGGEALEAAGVTVAVVDSGVAAIESLADQLLPGIDVLHPRYDDAPPTADRGSISPDDAEAWDMNGHGTAMASLVGALAPGARVLPVRVVKGNCKGTVFDLAEGIRAATTAGADVISISLSTPHDSPVLRDAVAEARAAGVLVVAAAGNDGAVEYPAALPGVVAVTAVDAAGRPPSFAPLGERIDVAAPGVDIIASSPDGSLLITGTSPATAIVAASAAIVASHLEGASGDDWRVMLLRATRPPDAASADLVGLIGSGILDMSRLPRD